MSDVRLTANARALASRQVQAVQQHAHSIGFRVSPNRVEAITGEQAWALLGGSGMTTDAAGTAETRPRNVAYHPRVHA